MNLFGATKQPKKIYKLVVVYLVHIGSQSVAKASAVLQGRGGAKIELAERLAYIGRGL